MMKEIFADDLAKYLVVLLLIIFFIMMTPEGFFSSVNSSIETINTTIETGGSIKNSESIQSFLSSLKNVLAVLGVLFFVGLVMVVRRKGEVNAKLFAQYESIKIEETEAKEMATQWAVVLNHINSLNPAEWKLGILEADNMLGEILEDLGYRGESIGEKLKAVDPSDMQTYSDAWEAHKVRNQVAHEGSTMDFSAKIARDTINRYEKVFKELGYL